MNRRSQPKKELARRAMAGTAAVDPVVDRILAGEDALIPSSGFAASVMERVRDEASAPAPIPFPWKRILPGVILAIAALGWCVFEMAQTLLSTAKSLPPAGHLGLGGNLPAITTAGWIALALLAPLLAWLFARRVVGGSALL